MIRLKFSNKLLVIAVGGLFIILLLAFVPIYSFTTSNSFCSPVNFRRSILMGHESKASVRSEARMAEQQDNANTELCVSMATHWTYQLYIL